MDNSREQIERVAAMVINACEGLIPEVDVRTVRNITGALKDVMDVLGLRLGMDEEEQRIKIDNLLRAAKEAADEKSEIRVVLAKELEDLAE